MRISPRRSTAIALDVVSAPLTITGRFCAWQLRSVTAVPSLPGLTMEFLVDLLDGSPDDAAPALFGFRSRSVESVAATVFRAWGRVRTPHGYDARTRLSFNTVSQESGLLGVSLSMSYEKLDEQCWREVRQALLQPRQSHEPLPEPPRTPRPAA